MYEYYYLNDDKTVRPCNFDEMIRQFKEMELANGSSIRHDNINGYVVSTIWLGLNYNHRNPEIPHIFETMVFIGDKAGYGERHSTYDDALKGHERAVDWVKGIKNE